MLDFISQYYGIDLIATALTFWGLHKLCNKQKAGFTLGFIGNLLWLTFGFFTASAGLIIANLGLAFLNLRGLAKWKSTHQFIDLSHTLKDGMDVYPGDTPPHLCQTAHLEEDGVNGYQLNSGMHVGTHIDAPEHMIDGGKRIPAYSVEKFEGRGVLIDARSQSKIDINLLANIELQIDDIVIVHTDHYKLFGQKEYYADWPEVTEAFAQALVKAKVSLLGLDTPSPDQAPFPIHKILLSKDILIIENLTNLDALHQLKDFRISAYPAKFDAEAAPTRVVAIST